MSNTARVLSILALVAVLVALGLVLWPLGADSVASRAGPGEAGDRVERRISRQQFDGSRERAEPAEPAKAKRLEEARRAERAERAEQLRRQILAAERRRASAPSRRPAAESGPEAASATGPGLRNRLGGDEALVARFNEDFMPLADECIDAAHERAPQLAGTLALNFEIVADEELGTIVETVDFPEQNQIEDEELRTCVRETTLSMILPAAESGRTAFMLTIPVEGEGRG